MTLTPNDNPSAKVSRIGILFRLYLNGLFLAVIGLIFCGTFLQAGLQMGADQLAEFVVGALWVAPVVLGLLFLFGPLFFLRIFRLVGLLQKGGEFGPEPALEFWRQAHLVPFRGMLLSMLTWTVGTPLMAWWMVQRGAFSIKEAVLGGSCCLLLGMTTSVGFYLRARLVVKPALEAAARSLPPDFKPPRLSSISGRLFWAFLFMWVAITGSLGTEAYFWLSRSELDTALGVARDRIQRIRESGGELTAPENLGAFSLRPFLVDLEGNPVGASRLSSDELVFIKSHHRMLGQAIWEQERSFHAYLSGLFSRLAPIPEFARLPDRQGTKSRSADQPAALAPDAERWVLLDREPIKRGLHPGVVVEHSASLSPLASSQRLVISLLMMFLVTALVTAGFYSAWLSREVGGSIRELKKAFDAGAQGSERRLASVKDSDELGELTASFNRLLLVLNQEIADREQKVSAVSDLIVSLEQIMSGLSGISTEQATDAAEQAVGMQEISSTSEEIAATLRVIAENAQSVEEVAGKSLSACHGGQGKLDELIGRLDSAAERTVEVANRMLSLQEQADRIEGILDFIREISEKTNLISLNASIEASSAGRAGERFSIISQEIRKLAENTMTGTKQIQELFTDLQAASSKAIIATEEGEKVVALARKLADQAAESFQTIIHWASETARAAHEIAISSGQQTTATDHLAGALSELREVANRFAGRAKNLDDAVSELESISPRLQGLLGGGNAQKNDSGEEPE